ncbi:peptide synthetase [Agrobacterium sp. ATCC 31749]|nr:peptide synthetase [Agrobacterium sp. ATCC 31749]
MQHLVAGVRLILSDWKRRSNRREYCRFQLPFGGHIAIHRGTRHVKVMPLYTIWNCAERRGNQAPGAVILR